MMNDKKGNINLLIPLCVTIAVAAIFFVFSPIPGSVAWASSAHSSQTLASSQEWPLSSGW